MNLIPKILNNFLAVAIVGISVDQTKDSYKVASYLKGEGYIIIPINPNYGEILGEKCYPKLSAVPFRIDIVNIFRKPEAVMLIAEEALRLKVKAVWMQLGIEHPAAAEKLQQNGIMVIMNKCIKIEHAGLPKKIIFGNLNDVIKNNVFPREISSGLDYLDKLKEEDFKEISFGQQKTFEVDARNIFAINQNYQTKNHQQEKFEAHRKFIDLQFIFFGKELIKTARRKNAEGIENYDQEKDVQFFKPNSFSSIILETGMVAIFYPQDIHAPCLRLESISPVTKSVVKVSVDI